MKHRNALTISLLLLSLLLTAGCGRVGRSTARRVVRNESSRALLRRDLLRDRATPTRSLRADRTVFRYTTRAQAEREIRSGIGRGRHFTSRANPGRPLAPASAQARYGLPRQPEVRMTVRLPRGTNVRRNRALGGAPGIGEVTTMRRTSPQNIRRLVPLSQP